MCNQCNGGQHHQHQPNQPPQQPPHLPYGVKSFAPPMGRVAPPPPWMMPRK
jgi:hypothetical protein